MTIQTSIASSGADTLRRIPANASAVSVTVAGTAATFSYDVGSGIVSISSVVAAGQSIAITYTPGSTSSAAASAGPTWQIVGMGNTALLSPNDTNLNTVATVSVPFTAVGPNGSVRATCVWSCTNNANTKTVRSMFNGTTFMAQNAASNNGVAHLGTVSSRGSAGAQVAANVSGSFGFVSAIVATAFDWSAGPLPIQFAVTKSIATDVVTLERYMVEAVFQP